jgi:hypothetical protein
VSVVHGANDRTAQAKMAGSYNRGDARNPEIAFGSQDVAYLRAKAAYLRRVATAAIKPEFMDPAVTIKLLEGLAYEFEKRALEIECELRARHSRQP